MSLGQWLLLLLLLVTAIFLIVLVLIQRGKGGGLAGALGGMGGQSAFGTKAGDLFTKITIGVAAFWIILCLLAGKGLAPSSKIEEQLGSQTVEQKEQPGPASEKAPEKSLPSTPAPKSETQPGTRTSRLTPWRPPFVLLSMTGFGEAHCQENGLTVSIEIRTINSRYFKLSVRSSEGYGSLEPQLEEVIRKTVHRGTVQVGLRVDRQRPAEDFRINHDVLERYHRQLQDVQNQWGVKNELSLAVLLPLPGVVEESVIPHDMSSDWPIIGRALVKALENLSKMRADEGRAMTTDLAANCRTVAANLTKIEARASSVAEDYRARLHERLQKILQEYAVVLDPADLIKEVSLYADRADISEEIVRLRSHVEQFLGILEAPESAGRKLEFLTQEMVREANTIGSKANDVEIARQVIEIKTAIERIREMIQNIE